jgi:TetR/AcrR family transcriptional regulator, repressor for uid operon
MPKVVREYKEQARSRIVDAAGLVLHRKGLGGMTMDEIAREIGVSKGALYLYFPSKGQLLEAILSRFRGEMMARLERAVAEGDVAEGIASTIDKIFSGEFNPAVWHQVVADAAADPEIQEALQQDSRMDSKELQGLLRRMEAKGRIPPQANPDVIADIIYLLLGGTLLMVSTRRDPGESRERLVRAIRWTLGLSLGDGGTGRRRSSRPRHARSPRIRAR